MQAAFRKSCIDCLNIEKCNFRFAGMLQNPFGTIGRTSIHGHALYVRSVGEQPGHLNVQAVLRHCIPYRGVPLLLSYEQRQRAPEGSRVAKGTGLRR